MKAPATIAELYQLAWKLHWSKPRYQASRWAKEVEGCFRRNIEPAFGTRRISSLTPKVIRRWLADYSEKPYAGNRSLEVLSRMFTFAEEEEIIPVGANPCRVVRSLPEIKRDRFATEDELKRILAILQKRLTDRRSRAGAAFLLTLLRTGARPISIAKAMRSDIRMIDHNGATWGLLQFVGKSTLQTGKREKIMFSPDVLALINQVPPPRDGTLFGIKKATRLWAKVIIEAGCPDLWSRDLRRTFATLGMSSGVGIDVVGELLNHSSAQTTKLYAKLMDSARVSAVSQISERLDRIEKKPA